MFAASSFHQKSNYSNFELNSIFVSILVEDLLLYIDANLIMRLCLVKLESQEMNFVKYLIKKLQNFFWKKW